MKDSPSKRWIWDNELEDLVPAEEYQGYRSKKDVHYVMADIPDYISPTTQYNVKENDHTPERLHGKLKVVSGRAQRREDLKRSDCHEVDPGGKTYTQKWKERNQKDPSELIRQRVTEVVNDRWK